MKKALWRGQPCWNCGQRPATRLIFGYPVCTNCTDIDPEEMEDVVIEAFRTGHLVPMEEIRGADEN
jgi:hypothetical protein